MDSNFQTNEFYIKRPTEQYEVDFDKITSIQDCVGLLKLFMLSQYKHVYINNTSDSVLYEQLKRLAKDGSIEKI